MIPVPRQYRGELTSAANEAGLPEQVSAAQIQTESDWDPNAISPAGAEGIAQFEPSTWQQYGHGSPFNPSDAFPAYGEYMSALMSEEGEDMRNALAAYNAGPGNLPAGYSYADSILGKAGYPQSAKGKKPQGGVPYANPLRDVKNLSPGRVDMGVDYGGTGPIYALGPGTIANVYNSGWPGGAFISEKLSQGPAAGHYVYAAEDITPQVSVGQHVDETTIIGELTGGGIETGWAEPPGTGWALGRTQFTGSNATAYGAAYSDLLKALGAPPGTISGPVTGTVPAGWYRGGGSNFNPVGSGGGGGSSWGGWLDNFPIIGPILQGGQDTAHGLAAVAAVLEKFEHFIEWWAVPYHWIRIFCGIGGTYLVILGLALISRTGRSYSVANPTAGISAFGFSGPSSFPAPGGELAPAMGIGALTFGAVLLFFAFHNMPSDVTDFPSFLSELQAEVQGGAKASTQQGQL